MKFGLQEKHRDLGKVMGWKREGKLSVTGVVDRVEIQPAIFRNVNTGRKIANKKIRLRLRPLVGRAVWTMWFPYQRRVKS